MKSVLYRPEDGFITSTNSEVPDLIPQGLRLTSAPDDVQIGKVMVVNGEVVPIPDEE